MQVPKPTVTTRYDVTLVNSGNNDVTSKNTDAEETKQRHDSKYMCFEDLGRF